MKQIKYYLSIALLFSSVNVMAEEDLKPKPSSRSTHIFKAAGYGVAGLYSCYKAAMSTKYLVKEVCWTIPGEVVESFKDSTAELADVWLYGTNIASRSYFTFAEILATKFLGEKAYEHYKKAFPSKEKETTADEVA